MSIDVDVLTSADGACDAFVAGRADAFVCHQWDYAHLVAERLKYRLFYLVARENGVVHGVLPLTQVRSILFGKRTVACAFSNYGGPLVDDPRCVEPLVGRAVELTSAQRCRYLELRCTSPLAFPGLHTRDDKMCMHLPLGANPEMLWKAFDAKVRNQVRKAEKSGIVALSGGPELLGDFYEVYTIRMRQLGTPPYPRRLMLALLEHYAACCRIFAVRLDGRTVGAGFVCWFNGLMEILWAATLVQYNHLCPNNLLYWAVIKHGCLAGQRYFDFGRCTEGGATYQFKKQWGAQPVRLYYQYWVPPGQPAPDLSPASARYQRKVEMWKRLPLWVTRAIGPIISRGLP